MRPRMRVLAAMGMAAVTLLLSSCGEDSSTTADDPKSAPTTEASTTPSQTGGATDWPACGDVWTDGGKVPKGYQGCLDDGSEVRADKTRCSSGQVLVTFEGRFYGVVGGRVSETRSLKQDSGYRSAQQACLA